MNTAKDIIKGSIGSLNVGGRTAIFVDEILKDIVENKVTPVILAQLQAVDPNITGVHFKHGHIREIVKELEELSKGTTTKTERYPLVALLRDFPEVNGGLPGIYSQPSLNLIIATRTDPSFNSDQRKEKSFKPILYPIWFEFLNQCDLSGRFMTTGDDQQNFTQIDRYFWGREAIFGSKENIFQDWIDCIEIQKLNLKTYDTP